MTGGTQTTGPCAGAPAAAAVKCIEQGSVTGRPFSPSNTLICPLIGFHADTFSVFC